MPLWKWWRSSELLYWISLKDKKSTTKECWCQSGHQHTFNVLPLRILKPLYLDLEHLNALSLPLQMKWGYMKQLKKFCILGFGIPLGSSIYFPFHMWTARWPGGLYISPWVWMSYWVCVCCVWMVIHCIYLSCPAFMRLSLDSTSPWPE